MLSCVVYFNESNITFDWISFSTVVGTCIFRLRRRQSLVRTAKPDKQHCLSKGQQEQQNQTGIGSASEVENLTTGNIPVVGNATDIESQNDTSLAQRLHRYQYEY